jgi:hypothetical protein
MEYEPVLVWEQFSNARICYHDDTSTEADQGSSRNNRQSGLREGANDLS